MNRKTRHGLIHLEPPTRHLWDLAGRDADEQRSQLLHRIRSGRPLTLAEYVSLDEILHASQLCHEARSKSINDNT